MADAGYTFLPWCRRGLVAELDTPDSGGPIDQRAIVRIGVTITNAGAGGVDATLLGPGDVLGLDQRLIVRTEPRPGTTAFEPNHLAAVDFELPDLPWLVTPASPNGDVLRPWLALVVVEQQPGVTVGLEPGAPLPVLRIDDPADARVELPDPASIALWAHAQVLGDVDLTPDDLPVEIATRPNENVSRLVCPRRLRRGGALRGVHRPDLRRWGDPRPGRDAGRGRVARDRLGRQRRRSGSPCITTGSSRPDPRATSRPLPPDFART